MSGKHVGCGRAPAAAADADDDAASAAALARHISRTQHFFTHQECEIHFLV